MPSPHTENIKKLPDISKVIDLAIEYNSILVSKNISTIYYWIECGCDIDLDIIPAMAECMKKKKGVTSFNYWTNAVMASKLRRESMSKVNVPNVTTDEDKAKSYAWKRKRGIHLSGGEERLLNNYEQANGVIA